MAIKLLVDDKFEINMTFVGLRGIKIASLSKLARHLGAAENEIKQALAKSAEKADTPGRDHRRDARHADVQGSTRHGQHWQCRRGRA